MPFETYAKRKKAAAKAGQADVYQYDSIPPFLRRQLVMLLTDTIGPWDGSRFRGNASELWAKMAEILEREIENFPTQGRYGESGYDRFIQFLERTDDVDDWLSAVELAGRVMASFTDEYQHQMQERGALALLANPIYAKASQDFLTAHRHYRTGEWKDAVVAANRAFESCLKAICAKRKWKHDPGARASDLIKFVRDHGLFPAYLGDSLNTYVAMLKTGIPAVRNHAGGHGSAPTDPDVSEHLANFAINLTAANIVMIADCERALP